MLLKKKCAIAAKTCFQTVHLSAVQIAHRKCLKHHKNLSKQLLKPLETCKKQCGTQIKDLMTNPTGIIETSKTWRVTQGFEFLKPVSFDPLSLPEPVRPVELAGSNRVSKL